MRMWEIIENARGEKDHRREKEYGYYDKGPKMGYTSAHYKGYTEEEMEEMLQGAFDLGYEEGKKESKYPSLSKLRDKSFMK